MNNKVYLLIHNSCRDMDSEEDIRVFSTLALARKAMERDIAKSKQDNFWWDASSGKEHNHCIISATEDCFEACRGQNYTYFPR